MLVKCQNCQKEFITYPSRIKSGKSKFCSRKCADGKWLKKVCEKCFKEFEVIQSRENARFCSKECSLKGKVNKLCEVCKKEFSVYPVFEKQRFCSRRCKGLFMRGKPSCMLGKKNPNASKNPQVFKKGSIPWNKGKEHLRGSKNPNWKGGIDEEHKRIKQTAEYKEWRNKIYKKYKWTCVECKIHCNSKIITAHHIKEFYAYPEYRFDVNNGIVLCRKCHILKHRPRRKNYYEKRTV